MGEFQLGRIQGEGPLPTTQPTSPLLVSHPPSLPTPQEPSLGQTAASTWASSSTACGMAPVRPAAAAAQPARRRRRTSRNRTAARLRRSAHAAAACSRCAGAGRLRSTPYPPPSPTTAPSLRAALRRHPHTAPLNGRRWRGGPGDGGEDAGGRGGGNGCGGRRQGR